jgi:hypothetical protein
MSSPELAIILDEDLEKVAGGTQTLTPQEATIAASCHVDIADVSKKLDSTGVSRDGAFLDGVMAGMTNLSFRNAFGLPPCDKISPPPH